MTNDNPNPNPRRRRGLGLGLAAAVVLAGGAAVLVATSGPSGANAADLAAASQPNTAAAAELNTVLSTADSPSAASLAAASPASPASPASGAPAPGRAGHPCARAAGALRAAGKPVRARRVRLACGSRLGRLRLLGGSHGQVTYHGKAGDKTLAFERGTITAVSGPAVTVRAADGTTWTWHVVSDTVIRQGGKKIAASGLAAGQQVFAGGPVVNGADDARLIAVRPAAPAPAPAPST